MLLSLRNHTKMLQETQMKPMQENKMREILLEKITLNIGVGSPGENLERAVKLLSTLSQAKPVITRTKKRIPTWGLRPGLEIATKVTLRGEQAKALLKRLLAAVDQKIAARKFDSTGNFSFGIHEYLLIPEIKYDPEVGIIGLEIAVTLKRRGYRIARRALRPCSIPRRHRITKEEAIDYMKKQFGVIVE